MCSSLRAICGSRSRLRSAALGTFASCRLLGGWVTDPLIVLNRRGSGHNEHPARETPRSYRSRRGTDTKCAGYTASAHGRALVRTPSPNPILPNRLHGVGAGKRFVAGSGFVGIGRPLLHVAGHVDGPKRRRVGWQRAHGCQLLVRAAHIAIRRILVPLGWHSARPRLDTCPVLGFGYLGTIDPKCVQGDLPIGGRGAKLLFAAVREVCGVGECFGRDVHLGVAAHPKFSGRHVDHGARLEHACARVGVAIALCAPSIVGAGAAHVAAPAALDDVGARQGRGRLLGRTRAEQYAEERDEQCLTTTSGHGHGQCSGASAGSYCW